MKYIFSIRAQDYRVVRTFLIVSSTGEGLIEEVRKLLHIKNEKGWTFTIDKLGIAFENDSEMQCLKVFES